MESNFEIGTVTEQLAEKRNFSTAMQYPNNPMEIKEGAISRITLTLHGILLAMDTFA
jgi:hypothetical protein